MPITVVINRDDVGATTCREVYAAGARYQIGDSNLQILSAQSKLLALYGSGNWLSVHVDGPAVPAAVAAAAAANAVAVAVAVAVAAAAAAAAAVAVAETDADADLLDLPGADLDADLDAGFVAPDEPIADPAGPDSVSGAPAVDEPEPSYEHPQSDPGSIQWGVSERMAAQSSSLRPVVFRPKTYRGAREGDTAEPAASGSQWGPASRIRPVVFRMKTYRNARPTGDEPEPVTDEPDGED